MLPLSRRQDSKAFREEIRISNYGLESRHDLREAHESSEAAAYRFRVRSWQLFVLGLQRLATGSSAAVTG